MKNSDRAGQLDTILDKKQLSTLFQVIFSLKERKAYGYEALARGPYKSDLYKPIALFSYAFTRGHLQALDKVSSALALRRFERAKLSEKIFINLSPQTITSFDSKIESLLNLGEAKGVPPEKVVIEVTEHFASEDLSQLISALNKYRAMGVEVAIDDFGAGYSGLRQWLDIEPDYIKLDGHFVKNVNSDKKKRLFIESVKSLTDKLGCKLIVEGIETKEEFSFISDLGVDLVQGYFIGYPQRLVVH
ncbi:MAG: EAL domain-containing protein [Pseudomonadales bacterium]|nr:EAL domain-containing protein [Pseudomonadales bacterium]